MITLYRILSLAIVLGIIVLAHEFGHYVAARLMGVRVETFSFGFGKRLFGKKIGHTDFRVSLIPLGGFVKMAGEEEYEMERLTGGKEKEPPDIIPGDSSRSRPYEFQAKNRAQKIFILLMGPLMNLVLAFVILTAINIAGVTVEKYKMEPPVIGYIVEKSPAAAAGFVPGDRILEINSQQIENWKDLDMAIASKPNEQLKIIYLRNGQRLSTNLTVEATQKYNIGYAGFLWDLDATIEVVNESSPADEAGLKAGDTITAVNEKPIRTFFEVQDILKENAGETLNFTLLRGNRTFQAAVTPVRINERFQIGVSYSIETTELSYRILPAMQKSMDDIVRLAFLIFDSIRKMISGKLSPTKNISGFIEIAEISHDALTTGLSNFFMLIAFISLNLGLVNLLPIPVLDGGHLMIYSLEAVIRREFSPRVKAVLMNIGFFILIFLMVFVILNDIAKKLPNGWASLLPF